MAALIKADIGIEAAQVDIGGWDTHAQQDPIAGQMSTLMQNFSDSLGAFWADVVATGYPATVVSQSEFGRNVKENGSAGTDHGRATAMFAMGAVDRRRTRARRLAGLSRWRISRTSRTCGSRSTTATSSRRSCRAAWATITSTSLPGVHADVSRRGGIGGVKQGRGSRARGPHLLCFCTNSLATAAGSRRSPSTARFICRMSSTVMRPASSQRAAARGVAQQRRRCAPPARRS